MPTYFCLDLDGEHLLTSIHSLENQRLGNLTLLLILTLPNAPYDLAR